MIHGSSSDPVLIKKVQLKVWTLRAEIESSIQKQIDSGVSPDNVDLQKLKTYYDSQRAENNQVDEPGTQDDSAQEETAEAAPEGDAEAGGEESQSEEVQQNEMVVMNSSQIPEDRIIEATTIISEVNMDTMYFFCDAEFLSGQSVVIEFLVPNRFVVNAEVIFSRTYNMKSRIISQRKLPYRIAVKFTFPRPGERSNLREFIKSIEPDLEQVRQKAAQEKAAKAADDSFDELDDLDL